MNKSVSVVICTLSIILITQSITSCVKVKCRMVDCGPYMQFSISTNGFSRQDIDTIYLRKYIKGTGFSQQIETLEVIKDKNATHIYSDASSDYINIISNSRGFIESSFDYEVYFPATNTLRKLSDIIDVQSQKQYCSPSLQKKECNNDNISSCKIDGVLYNDRIPALNK
jgi:hypothetical protein